MEKMMIVKNRCFGGERPAICIPVIKAAKEDIIEETKRLVELGAEVIELRIDAFEAVESLNEIRDLLRNVKPLVAETPFIFTFRSKTQGGMVDLRDDMIYDIHQVAAESGAVDFVDVEFFKAGKPLREIRELRSTGVRVIASHHDFEETPDFEVIELLLSEMAESRADVLKLALMPRTEQDVLTLLNATNHFHKLNPSKSLITMSMGKLGMISRIGAGLFGSIITFGNAGEISAPGQIEFKKMKQILDIINAS